MTETQSTLAFDRNDLDRRYRQWKVRNPNTYAIFLHYATELAYTGRRFGIAMLFERVRWDMHINPDPHETFKLNNSYRAYLARDLIRDLPILERLVETRRVR